MARLVAAFATIIIAQKFYKDRKVTFFCAWLQQEGDKFCAQDCCFQFDNGSMRNGRQAAWRLPKLVGHEAGHLLRRNQHGQRPVLASSRNKSCPSSICRCNQTRKCLAFIPRITQEINSHIWLLSKLAFEYVISKHRNVRASTAVVVIAEVDISRLKDMAEVIQTLRICADKVEYSLLRIGKGKKGTELSQSLYHAPLSTIRVLKFIQDDNWVHCRKQLPNPFASMEDVTDIRSKKVKAYAPFSFGKAQTFSRFIGFFRKDISVIQISIGTITRPNCRQCDRFARRGKNGQSSRQPD